MTGADTSLGLLSFQQSLYLLIQSQKEIQKYFGCFYNISTCFCDISVVVDLLIS